MPPPSNWTLREPLPDCVCGTVNVAVAAERGVGEDEEVVLHPDELVRIEPVEADRVIRRSRSTHVQPRREPGRDLRRQEDDALPERRTLEREGVLQLARAIHDQHRW